MPKRMKLMTKDMMKAKSQSMISKSRHETGVVRSSTGTPRNLGYARNITIPKTNKRK